MENNQVHRESIGNKENAEDIKILLIKYLSYWPYFLISVFIFASAGYFYLRYTPSIYQTNSKIKILKDKGGIDMTGFQGNSPLIDMSRVNLENESEIIKSRRLTRNVILNLGLQTKVRQHGTIRTIEVWKNEIPFEILWENENLESLKTILYEITFLSPSKFIISNKEADFEIEENYGNLITHDDVKFRILLKDHVDENKYLNKTYTFSHQQLDPMVSILTSKINVENIGQSSEILNISLNGPNQRKNEDIINNLVEQFNNDGIEDNRKLAKRTENFVVERLTTLNEELDTVEKSLVDFKTESGLVTIDASAQEIFGKNTTSDNLLFEVKQQLMLAEDFQNEIDQMEDYELLPANIGISDRGVNQLTGNFNQLILERQQLLVSSTEESLAVKEIDKQLNKLKLNILRTLNGFKRQLELKLNEIDNRERFTRSRISQLPSQEKEIREITRQQSVKERLYVFLLQKREEATLSAAVASDIIKIVDYAYTNPTPVSPKPKIVLLGSVLIGLIIPFGFIYIKLLLDTKIYTKDEIKSGIGDVPIVAEIPFEKGNENRLISKNETGSVAESFRILRTNLKFMQNEDTNKESNSSKVIFVTSTMKGEGKTFTSVNASSLLSAANKRVLLIGADLRNPQVHNLLNLDKSRKGLSYYLYDTNADINELIIKKEETIADFDVMLSGEIPPNPSELLSNGRFSQLLEELKNLYDYIVVDTAPTILVTDSFLISDYADFTLYMIRSGHTENQLLGHIKDIYTKKKLKNIGIVFNGLKNNGAYAYNYGYGYGYNETSKKRNRLKFW